MKTLLSLSLLFLSTNLFAQKQDSSAYFYQKGIEEKAGKKYLLASVFFEKAIHSNPGFTAAHMENGYVNMEMHKTDAARQSFARAHELEPNNQAAIKELAELHFKYREYQQAIDFAQKCRTCEGMENIIGMSYYRMEDYANAEKVLKSLIAKHPSDAEATYTLGRTYLEMEMKDKAIPVYRKAIELDGTKSQWTHELGLLYYNRNDFKNAVVYFNKALAQGFTATNDFNENLGFAYIYSGESEKGEKILLDIISRKPGDKDILRDIADAYYDQKKYDKALDFCQKLLEMDMKDGKALYKAGLCFQKKGETSRGQQMCDKAIELDPSLSGLRQKKSMDQLR